MSNTDQSVFALLAQGEGYTGDIAPNSFERQPDGEHLNKVLSVNAKLGKFSYTANKGDKEKVEIPCINISFRFEMENDPGIASGARTEPLQWSSLRYQYVLVGSPDWNALPEGWRKNREIDTSNLLALFTAFLGRTVTAKGLPAAISDLETKLAAGPILAYVKTTTRAGKPYKDAVTGEMKEGRPEYTERVSRIEAA